MAATGGGGELMPFRTLSQHIKVHTLAPPPQLISTPSPTAGRRRSAAPAPAGIITPRGVSDGVGGGSGAGANNNAVLSGGKCAGGAAGQGASGGRVGAANFIKQAWPMPPLGEYLGEYLGAV